MKQYFSLKDSSSGGDFLVRKLSQEEFDDFSILAWNIYGVSKSKLVRHLIRQVLIQNRKAIDAYKKGHEGACPTDINTTDSTDVKSAKRSAVSLAKIATKNVTPATKQVVKNKPAPAIVVPESIACMI